MHPLVCQTRDRVAARVLQRRVVAGRVGGARGTRRARVAAHVVVGSALDGRAGGVRPRRVVAALAGCVRRRVVRCARWTSDASSKYVERYT